MKAYVSLWSADPLAIGAAVDLVGDRADGFHVEVFDGHTVPDLLFGPHFVAALRRRTGALIDVHLSVDDPDFWAKRFIASGGDMVTVQARACPDLRATLDAISRAGARRAVALEVDEPVEAVYELLADVDRVLVMGTRLGVKGVDLDRAAADRVTALVEERRRREARAEIVVDGGIRRHTVPTLALAGADGVVPGSLVFGDPDPRSAIDWIHSLPVRSPTS